MKKCSQCGQPQPLANFYRRATRGNEPFAECKDCASVRHGLTNLLPEVKAANLINARKLRGKRSEWYYGLKHMKPCTDCGVAYPWYVMQWDHIGDKEDHVSTLYRNHVSRAKILAEIAKCELVCANCHFTRTHLRQESYQPEETEHIAS